MKLEVTFRQDKLVVPDVIHKVKVSYLLIQLCVAIVRMQSYHIVKNW